MTFISHSLPLGHPRTSDIFARAAQATAKIIGNFVNRRTMRRSLETLSDKQLRDIGLTRHDVASITRAPALSGGTHDLSTVRDSRSGNW